MATTTLRLRAGDVIEIDIDGDATSALVLLATHESFRHYEPWGYTPMECVAMGLPAVTTDLSGFGAYVQQQIPNNAEQGLIVINRRTARNLGIAEGDAVILESASGRTRGTRRTAAGVRATTRTVLLRIAEVQPEAHSDVQTKLCHGAAGAISARFMCGHPA